jgi:hypothetical protein
VVSLAILLVTSLVFNGILVWKNRRLKTEAQRTNPNTNSATAPTAEATTMQTLTDAASTGPKYVNVKPSQNGPSYENVKKKNGGSSQNASPGYSSLGARDAPAPTEYAALDGVYQEITENQMRR